MFLAHYWRSQQESLSPPASSLLSQELRQNQTETELAQWFNQNFAGFWSLYFPAATAVSYIFFFGIGGFLHVSGEWELSTVRQYNNNTAAFISSSTMLDRRTLPRTGSVSRTSGCPARRRSTRCWWVGSQ